MPFRVEMQPPSLPPPPAPSSAASASQPNPSHFSALLAQLGQRVDAGEGWMRRALSPDAGALDAAQLIALQAGIYRYTEAVELVGRLVDRATSGIKTVLEPR